MKTDTVYKLAFNRLLDLVAESSVGARLPSENALSQQLAVSRTTIRKVLHQFDRQNITGVQGRGERLVRTVPKGGRFPVDQTVPGSEQVEKQFLEWMQQDNALPGSTINEAELARQFGVGTTGIREFLNRFSRFGLIEKRPNTGWLFKGFTTAFALELFEIREMFEKRSAVAFTKVPEDDPIWSGLAALRVEHERLLESFEARYQDFSDLDNRFHLLINSAAPNRFIDDFYGVITVIFHYHYQWNKRDERRRNRVAIIEHLAYIDALISRDEQAVETACRQHLRSARETLLAAVPPG